MAKKPKNQPEEKINIYNTMAQPEEAQQASQQLSELQDIKQHAEAPPITGYMLLRPIGRGAYAQVWEAIQIRTRKFVAVKVFLKKSGVHWFFLQREADRMIRLDKHPNIVSLLDADLSGEIPYYVMDLAQEGSLEKFIHDKKNPASASLDVNKVVTWMEEIARALNYVHGKQMVHCDLKPANILLDEEGHVRVADFGHSRILTESGGALGTLFYMAPEQATMPDPNQPIQPDVRWDIYALGCTVYSLLSGHVPHEDIGKILEETPGLLDRLKIYRQSIETETVPELYTATKGRVDRDLSAIVAQCMKTKPEDRYKTMAEVLKDLKARREGKPVSPLAKDPGYWMGKFLSRYRAAVIMAGVALIVGLAALVVLDARQKAQVQDMAFSYVLKGKECLEKGDEASATAYFAAANKIFPSLLARGNAVLHQPRIPTQFFPNGGPVLITAFSPDGKTLLTASEASGTKIWDLKDNSLVQTLKTSGKTTAAAFSPDGSRVATGDSHGELKIFDLSLLKTVDADMKQDMEIVSVAFSPDGRQMVSASADGTAQVWDAKTGEPLKFILKHTQALYEASFSPDGKMILTAGQDGTAHVWDAQNGSSQSDPIHLEIKNALASYKPDVFFTSDSKTIAATGWDGSVRFYDKNGRHAGRNLFLEGLGVKAFLSADGRQIVTSVIHDDSVGLVQIFNAKSRAPTKFSFKSWGKNTCFDLSPDGSQVLAGGTDHSVRIWSTATGKPAGQALWHGDTVTTAAFNASGQFLVTGSKDGIARLWDCSVDSDNETPLDWKKSGYAHEKKNQTRGLFSPDGKWLLTYGNKNACLWDAGTGKAAGIFTAPGKVTGVSFSPDGQSLLLCGENGAQLDAIPSGQSLLLKQDGRITGAFSADGKVIVTGSTEKTLCFWDAHNGQALNTLKVDSKITKVFISPNGERIGMAAANNFKLTDKEGKVLVKLNKSVKDVLFSSDSQKVWAASGTDVSLYDASAGKLLNTFKPGAGLDRILMTPDNNTLITLGSHGTGQLWKALTAEPVGDSMKHDGAALQAVLSPQGNALLIAYKDGGWEIWDTQTGESIGDEVQKGVRANALVFDADSRNFKIAGADGKILKINTNWVDPKMDPDQLVNLSKVAGLCKVTSDGSLESLSIDQWTSLWSRFQKAAP